MGALVRSTGFALVFGVLGLASPAHAQFFYTQTMSQVSLAVVCNTPSCTCTDPAGDPILCPGTHLRQFDSGQVAAPTGDLYSADVTGTFVGFDATTVSDATANGSASFGTLSALVAGSNVASGSYVLAGGLAIPGSSDVHVSVAFQDQLAVTGPAPGVPATLAFTQAITSAESASETADTSIDPCLSTSDADVLLNASLSAFDPIGGAGDLVQFARFGDACTPFQNNGSPLQAFSATFPDGATVNLGQSLALDVSTSLTGGVAQANRALAVDALLDASSTANVYVEVLTPGASYTSASGTTYPVPEPDAVLGSLVALALVLAGAPRRAA